MKPILFLLLISLPLSYFSNNSNLKKVRLAYVNYSSSEQKANHFFKTLEENTSPTPEVCGYNAMAFFLKSKHSINPYTKWTQFSKGKTLMEKTIEENPHNVELRYLRLCVQIHAPKFLQYHKNIESDSIFLLQQAPKLTDLELKKLINNLLKDNNLS